MNKENKDLKKRDRSFDEGTHPGAYTEKHDINNELLDTVDSSDDVFNEEGKKKDDPANHARPPAADPPVPNMAHTEM